jgi:putative flippase GtrA
VSERSGSGGHSERLREVSTFGLVGALAYLIDAGGFNLLVHAPSAPLTEKPLTAKVISTSLAIIWAYFGNREWTWRHRERARLRREFSLFLLLNFIAMGIAVTTLGISRYLLGFESALADNISANVVGVGLGTLFRFWSYQRWIFRKVINPQ